MKWGEGDHHEGEVARKHEELEGNYFDVTFQAELFWVGRHQSPWLANLGVSFSTAPGLPPVKWNSHSSWMLRGKKGGPKGWGEG